VGVLGAQKYAVRVRLDPRALAARGIGIDEVRSALDNNNVNLPAGTLDGAHKATTLLATGQLKNAEGFRQVIVSYRNGAAVRLGDVARVEDGVENEKSASWFDQRMREDGTEDPGFATGANPRRAILLSVQRQPGTNTIAVVDGIKALLPAFQAQLPDSIKLEVYLDRSEAIRESVHDVKFTLLLAILLVVLVIFLFLRTLSATIIPSIAMPIAIIGTFGVMYFCGFSINNISLLALTLSVGFVVDDAIVMLENIVRHIEAGDHPMTAALKGSREIGFTIISMTISLVAVFIPVLFMGGILGRLLHEFAVTIGAAILVSGVVSLTLTPMLCSRFLRPRAPDHAPGRFYVAMERVFDASVRLYERTLRISLRFRGTVLAVAAATVGLTPLLGAARESARQQVPLIGVNRGSLGFLTTLSAEEARGRFPDLLAGRFQVDHRTMLDCATGPGSCDLALNDVLIKDEVNSRLVRLEVFADDELVTDYLCDGLIFSTPTGSTAYNLSAGGPILHPGSGVIVMTPICPHTLSNRAIIFRDDVRIRVHNRSPGSRLLVAMDGQRNLRVSGHSPVTIALARRRLPLAQTSDYSHFNVVRQKLQWSGGFSAKR